MTTRRLWVSLALVALLAAALGGYYWIHKPVTPAQAAVLASALADGGVAALLTLLGGGVGRRCLRGLAPEGGAPGERAAVEVALGWGLVGLTTLGLGFVRLYYPVVIWVGVGLAFLISWRDARDWALDAISPLRLFWVPGRLSRFAGLFVWLTLGLGLLRALTPPLMWDALMYHLTLPKLYAQAHQIHIDTDIVFTSVPQLPDMLYTAAFLMRGAIAAQTLGWAFGAALALGLASHAGELLGEGLGGLAPAVLFSSLTIAASLAWAYSELLMMLMALGGLIALRRWSQENDRRWLWLSGLLAGLAVGCKYNAFIVPVAGAVVIALTHLHPSTHSTLRRFILHPLSFIVFAFLAFVPWLLKSWLETGHPISALLVPSGPDGALRHWLFNRPDLAERNLLWAALIFFRVVFLGVQGGSLYDATIGPLFAFLPLALLLGWRGLSANVRQALGLPAGFVLVGYLLWMLLTFNSPLALQARYFFALFPALALLCAAGLEAVRQLDSRALRVSVIVNALVALVLGVSLLENGLAFAAQNPLGYLAGAQSASDYRKANLGWYAVAIERVNALPAGSRVTFLWEARSLECAAPDRCAPDAIIDRWWLLRRTVGTASAAITRWKAQGLTHALIYDLGANFVRDDPTNAFSEADWAELEALRGQMRLIENVGGVYSLYELP